jgi:dolichol-phosphate mannosyltransferase
LATVRVLVVLPTYNESVNIGPMLRAIRSSFEAADVLVVDDASPDGTAKLAQEVADELGSIHLLERAGKEGLGPAYRAGFAWGLSRGYEVLVEMDCDFSHDPAALPAIVAPLLADADVSIGSRYVPGGEIPNWSAGRRLLSRGGNVYADLLLSLGVRDSTAGFRAYSSHVLERIDISTVVADGYGFQVEMTYRAKRAGARIVEVPIKFVDRVEGTSKMSLATVTEALRLVTLWGLERMVGRAPAAATAVGRAG